ncbi:PREDICTED: alkaline ceramidase 3-like isoform X3 [Acropora digitifera]|uniref:alkaline ceramidase 3-like isoform X3 n=1 Tax=Acropora digitifera TaxID=70779 RepID=UPI00077ACFA2|nr:PREDICTED: alkaline ceramidase 3-like isoform X3 [Acropora digitifera]
MNKLRTKEKMPPENTFIEGFWGDVTSTLDWCEENYVVSAFLAEFWNTISNWVFLIPPAFGAYLSFKNGLEHRYTLSFIALCVVGLGSVCFHATLLYEMQLLDELPMIYGTCILIFCSYQNSYKPRQYNRILILALMISCALITLMYVAFVNPLIFQWSYAILVVILIVGAYTSSKKHRHSQRLLVISLVSYGIGFLLWNIDNNFCVSLSIDVRLRHLEKGARLKLYKEWLPFVYPSKDASILPTVSHNATIFLLVFGLIIKLLK